MAFYCALGVAAAANPGGATALEWTRTEVKLSAHEGQEKVEAIYPVKNGGTRVVKVTGIETGCGCTSAQLPGMSLQPGATSELKVIFKLEGRVGQQSKLIKLKTDERGGEPSLLWLRVDIISPVVVQPRMLFWRAGDPVEAKPVDITLNPEGGRVKLGAVTCDRPEFTVTWAEGQPADKARLLIKPATTEAPVQAKLQLEMMVEDVKRTIVIYLFVK